MPGARPPIQIKNMTSGETVKIQVVCRLADEIYENPGRIEIEAPRFPRLISKSNGVRAVIESETKSLDRIPGATNKNVLRFSFQVNRRNSVRTLSLRVPDTVDVKKQGLIRLNSNTALPALLQNLDNLVLEVKNITRLGPGKPAIVEVHVPSGVTFSGFSTVTTATNFSITPYQKNNPGSVYSIEITDRGILENLEYHDTYRTLAIFAYERREQNSVPSDKIMANTNVVLSPTSPPAYSTLPTVYDCFASPKRVVIQLAKDDDVSKTLFHVAIAKYYKNRNNEWVGEWLQRDGDGKAIWKTVLPQPK